MRDAYRNLTGCTSGQLDMFRLLIERVEALERRVEAIDAELMEMKGDMRPGG